jgi:hypothetical protein
MQKALTNFSASLQRVRNLADDALANTAQAMKDPALRERHETALSAVVVTLSGFFESFLREIAEQYADAICQQSHPFTNLKANIRFTHFEGGGNVLSYIGGKSPSSRYGWTSSDAADMARRLASVNAGPPYELVWEAFAETGGNPGSDVVKTFLRRFGVKKPMETLAAQMNWTANTLTHALDSFIAIRNECAHTGKAINPPTAADVTGYCDLLELISNGIVKTLNAHQVC